MIIKENSDKNAFCDSYWIKAFLKAKSTSRFAKGLSSAIYGLWRDSHSPIKD